MDLSFCPVYGRGSCHSHDCDRWNTNDDSVSWSKGGREKENHERRLRTYLILNTINPNLLKLELKPPVLQSPKSDEASIPGGTEVISKEDYAKKVENDPNATKTQKEAAKVLVNDPNAGEVIVPKKPEEWSKLSASDKIKVFEKEAQKCVNKGDFGAVISSDGTVNCRECTGTKVPKPGTPTGETPKVSNCQLNQLCAGYSCQ